MIIETDNLEADKLTPEQLKTKLVKQGLNINLVILQFPNSEDFAEVFLECGAKTVISFKHEYDDLSREALDLEHDLDQIKHYHLVSEAMGKYVITVIEKIQTEKSIDDIVISFAGLTAILKNNEDLKKNGLQEISEKKL